MRLEPRNFELGSNTFIDALIPVLWGTLAVFPSSEGLTIGTVSQEVATIEIENGKPVPGLSFRPRMGGYEIHSPGSVDYLYSPTKMSVVDLDGQLPTLSIQLDSISVASTISRGNVISGAEVGILIRADGSVALGAQLPDQLRRRSIERGPNSPAGDLASALRLAAAVQFDPKTLEAIQKALRPDPKTLEAIQKALRPDPKTLEAIQKSLQPDPKTLEAIEKATQIDPKTLEAIEKATQIDPKTLEAIRRATEL